MIFVVVAYFVVLATLCLVINARVKSLAKAQQVPSLATDQPNNHDWRPEVSKPYRPAEGTIEADILRTLEVTDHPIKRADLANAVFADERAVRRAISDLNADGYPIVSNGQGFFLARTPEQLGAAAATLLAQARSLDDRAQDLLAMARELRDGGLVDEAAEAA